jgi:purine-binding chemotaxis protein CheW
VPDQTGPTGQKAGKKGLAVREHRIEYLGFVVCGHMYGVSLGEVREILRLPPLTEVPRAPVWVMGVVSVRGLLVTVIDLRVRLRAVSEEASRKGRVLLVEGADSEIVGLYVDEVLQVFRLAETEVEGAAAVLGSQTAEYVVGIGHSEGKMLTLIDLGAILGRHSDGEGHAA